MTAVHDIDAVDWLAVDVIRTGTPMRLGDDVPTMTAALATVGYDVTPDQLAERMGTTTRQIARILTKRLGAKHCPSCRRCLIIPEDGIVPRHVNCNGRYCRMAGHHISDTGRVNTIRRERRVLMSFK